MSQLLIIFMTILATVAMMRLLTALSLVWHVLPLKLLSNENKIMPHHFVWGNVLIVVISIMVVGLGMDPSQPLIAMLLGVGLGLALDEFPLWVGNVKELTRNIAIIPGALPAVAIFEAILVVLIVMQVLHIF